MLQNALKVLGLTVIPASVSEITSNANFGKLSMEQKVALAQAIQKLGVAKTAETPAREKEEKAVGQGSFSSVYLGNFVRCFGTPAQDKRSKNGNTRHEYPQVVIRFIPVMEQLVRLTADEAGFKWKAPVGENWMLTTDKSVKVDIAKFNELVMYADMSKVDNPQAWLESITVDVLGTKIPLKEYAEKYIATHISEIGTFLVKATRNGRLSFLPSHYSHKEKPFIQG